MLFLIWKKRNLFRIGVFVYGEVDFYATKSQRKNGFDKVEEKKVINISIVVMRMGVYLEQNVEVQV